MNLFKMVKDFLTGNPSTDTEEVQNFADLTTISKVNAEFDFKTNVTIKRSLDENGNGLPHLFYGL